MPVDSNEVTIQITSPDDLQEVVATASEICADTDMQVDQVENEVGPIFVETLHFRLEVVDLVPAGLEPIDEKLSQTDDLEGGQLTASKMHCMFNSEM